MALSKSMSKAKPTSKRCVTARTLLSYVPVGDGLYLDLRVLVPASTN